MNLHSCEKKRYLSLSGVLKFANTQNETKQAETK